MTVADANGTVVRILALASASGFEALVLTGEGCRPIGTI